MSGTCIIVVIWLIVAINEKFKDNGITLSASFPVVNHNNFEEDEELFYTDDFVSIYILILIHIFSGKICDFLP